MSEVYSYHVFLFPFKWEVYNGNNTKQTPFNSKAPLKEAKKQLNTAYWQKFEYRPALEPNYNTYNEYSYFYDFARDILCLDPEQQTIGVHQYSYQNLQANSKYAITTGGKQYELAVKEILLNLYENGVGILSFHLENCTEPNFKDILKINDLGRRIYPQFLGSSGNLTEATKYSLLPNSIALYNVLTHIGGETVEDFSHYDDIDRVAKAPFVLPAHIKNLLGNRFITKHEDKIRGDVIVYPVFDDRMFVLSYAVNQKLFEELAIWDKTEKQYAYAENTDWYQYIFLDSSGASCQSKLMLKEQLQTATYDRWVDYKSDAGRTEGHLFGMSRYSMVMLTADAWFPKNIVFTHIKNMYFQIVLLCLLQRATVVVFSGEVARISDKLSNDFSKLYNEKTNISRLYLWYIKFVNRIYFREVTPQEQGIELYTKLQDQMRIGRDVEDLGKELGELNNFVETIQQGQLTLIAGRFLPPTLIAAILGFSMPNAWPVENFWVAFVIVLLSFLLSDYAIRFLLKK